MNIQITGASGFVGQNLVPYLSQDHQITTKSVRFESEEKFNIVEDAIIHLAGKAHDLKQVSDSSAYYEANYEVTKRLYDAFLASSAKIFIYMSSVKAVADSIKTELSEDTIPRPETHYGKSKLMAENYIKAQFLPKGKKYYIFRPCMIHGPGNKGNLNLLYKVIKKGIPYPLAAFKNKRSFLSISNLCFIIKSFLSINDIPSGIYNVADDESLSTSEVVTILASSLNKKPRLMNISPAIIRFLAKIGDKLCLPLNSERLDKLTENYVVANDKVKSVINQSLPMSSREGLAVTAKVFK
jgi:nucleoside-diphosphate-sugar epimerase